MLNKRFFTLIGIILAAAATRLVPHPPNFTPIGAMALFGGATMGGVWAFAVPLTAMLVSDLILTNVIYGIGLFHQTMPFVYLSFAATVCLGRFIQNRVSSRSVASASVLAAALFFIISNFGVWLVGDHLYPKTLEGLLACYVAAIPFFGNTLSGDLFYSLVLFGGFAFAQRYWPVLRAEPAAVPARV